MTDRYSIASLVESEISEEIPTIGLESDRQERGNLPEEIIHHLWTELSEALLRKVSKDAKTYLKLADRTKVVAQINQYKISADEILALLGKTQNNISLNLVLGYMALLEKTYKTKDGQKIVTYSFNVLEVTLLLFRKAKFLL